MFHRERKYLMVTFLSLTVVFRDFSQRPNVFLVENNNLCFYDNFYHNYENCVRLFSRICALSEKTIRQKTLQSEKCCRKYHTFIILCNCNQRQNIHVPDSELLLEK